MKLAEGVGKWQQSGHKPMRSRFLNVHPGELLRAEFMQPHGLTAAALARATQLAPERLRAIVREERGITAETDLRLGAYFGQAPGYWLRVQLAFAVREARRRYGAKVKATVRPFE